MILFINLKANDMAIQFSWKRQNGEVVELLDEMPRTEDGTIKGGSKNMWLALFKKRPELAREFGHDLAMKSLQMDKVFDQIDQALKGK